MGDEINVKGISPQNYDLDEDPSGAIGHALANAMVAGKPRDWPFNPRSLGIEVSNGLNKKIGSVEIGGGSVLDKDYDLTQVASYVQNPVPEGYRVALSHLKNLRSLGYSSETFPPSLNLDRVNRGSIELYRTVREEIIAEAGKKGLGSREEQ